MDDPEPPSSPPADQEAVSAAKQAADTATENGKAECDKRGPNCRQRELDEQAAATALREVIGRRSIIFLLPISS